MYGLTIIDAPQQAATADYAGVWMYHCGTAPALHHIANGMFGMVIVEPKGGLPKVDQEVALVQSEWYLGAQKQPADYAKANAGWPVGMSSMQDIRADFSADLRSSHCAI